MSHAPRAWLFFLFPGSSELAQFQAYVAQGEIHYFIAGGMRGSGAGSANTIASWVAQSFASTTVDGVTVYDLTQPPAT